MSPQNGKAATSAEAIVCPKDEILRRLQRETTCSSCCSALRVMIQRPLTQLSLLEGATPWGPFSVFYRDDDWSGADGSKGGYTPVIPPAWVGEKEFWLVFTQCCGNPRPPLNNYNFIAQRVSFSQV